MIIEQTLKNVFGMIKIVGQIAKVFLDDVGNDKYSLKLKVGFRSKIHKTAKNPNGFSWSFFPDKKGEYCLETIPNGLEENTWVCLTLETLKTKHKSGKWFKLKNVEQLDDRPLNWESVNRIKGKGIVRNLKVINNGVSNLEYQFDFEYEDNIIPCVVFDLDIRKHGWNIKEGENILTIVPIHLPEYENGIAKKDENGYLVLRRTINYIVVKQDNPEHEHHPSPIDKLYESDKLDNEDKYDEEEKELYDACLDWKAGGPSDPGNKPVEEPTDNEDWFNDLEQADIEKQPEVKLEPEVKVKPEVKVEPVIEEVKQEPIVKDIDGIKVTVEVFKDLIKLADSCSKDEVTKFVLSKLDKVSFR